MDVGAHIYTSASESGYEPINQDTHTKETEEDDMLDNMAYGKVDSQIDIIGHQTQYDNAFIKLEGNESYNSTPQTPLPDEGEYSYTMTSLPMPVNNHQTHT